MGGDLCAQGEQLLSQGRYLDARTTFESAVASTGDPAALVGLATACRVLDDVPAAIHALERAYRAHLDHGDRAAAAHAAYALADVVLSDRGTASVARGWLTRAGQLLEDLPVCSAHVHVAGFTAYLALAYDKDPRTAREHASRAMGLAEELHDHAAIVSGRAYLGLIDVSLGDLDQGLQQLEAATAAASAGELPPEEALEVYCLLLTACERVRDVERVQEWAERVLTLATDGDSDAFAAFARHQYASALLLGGDWEAADREVDRVLRDSEARPLTAAMGLVTRARLRRLQGRLEEADEALSTAEREPYRRAVRHLVISSRAALELATGRPGAAADLAERYLRMVAETDLVERVDALETLCRARLATGEHERASAAAEKLAAIATRVPTPGLRGAALLAAGRVAGATGAHPRAVDDLTDAVDALDSAGLAYDATDARLALACALRDAGHPDRARREATSAAEEAQRLGAASLAQSGAALVASLRETGTVGDLTRRESEILRLAGEGLANGEIAERLVLSIRTVERHLSNIYLKVGATGPAARSVAIAYAHRHGLC